MNSSSVIVCVALVLCGCAGTASTPMAALLADMNARLAANKRSVLITGVNRSGAPDVSFGCRDSGADDCTGGGGFGRTRIEVGGRSISNPTQNPAAPREMRLRLSVQAPSTEWTTQAREHLDAAHVGEVLVLTLETGRYWACSPMPVVITL